MAATVLRDTLERLATDGDGTGASEPDRAGVGRTSTVHRMHSLSEQGPAAQRRRTALVVVAAVAALLLSGCGSGSRLTGTVVKEAGAACKKPAAVPTAPGKPTNEKFEARPPIGKDAIVELKPGNGEAAKVGNELTVELFVLSCNTGDQLFSTWDNAPAASAVPSTAGPSPTTAAPAGPVGPQKVVLKAPAVPQGLVDGLTGLKVGGQRQVTIPASLGVGSEGGNLPIGGTAAPGDTLVYVVQLDATGPAAATCEDSPVSDTGPDRAPIVTINPAGTVPTKLVVKDIKVGTGAVVKAGDKFSAQYTGYVCGTGRKFQASWDTGQPLVDATLTAGSLIQGWVDGIPGMAVGGRRVLVIPPASAYKDQSPSGSGIPANSTLFFVIELTKIG